jgi:hypothetical protein
MILQYRVTGWGTLTRPSLPAFLKRGAPQPAANPAVKTEGTVSVGKKPGKEVIPEQSGAKAVRAGSDKKVAVTSDIISQRKKGSHGKRRGKRKN